jgi:molecular chaperone DnaK (HSP70)
LIVGLDLGSAYTKIASLGQADACQVFRFPGDHGQELIPSSASHTGDFLRQILFDHDHSYTKTVGMIDLAVCSVPHRWFENLSSPEITNLQTILQDDLHLPILYLMSEPTCTAAAYTWQNRQALQNDRTRLALVCDLGASGFYASLCQVSLDSIQVLALAASPAGGNWFDLACVETARQAAGLSNPSPAEQRRLQKAFERVKIAQHAEAAEMIARLLPDPLLADTELYCFEEKHTLTLEQTVRAYSGVKTGIHTAVAEVAGRLEGQRLDAVILAGGFMQFPLAQPALSKALENIQPGVEPPVTWNAGCFSVAEGAALLAGGLVQAAKPFPHTLGLAVKRLNGGMLADETLPLIPAGQATPGMLSPRFIRKSPSELESILVVEQSPQFLPLALQLNGAGRVYPLEQPEPAVSPPPGRYSFGYLIDRFNQVIIVMQDAAGRRCFEINLGDAQHLAIKEMAK